MASPDRSARLLRLVAELRRERSNLDRVAGEVADALSLLATRPPSSLELRGAADLLHDWYSGLEKLLQLVSVSMDGGLPEGDRWHRRLLESMAIEVPRTRPAVLARATSTLVDPYLRFRHLFRNLYGFDLEWAQVQPLLAALTGAHAAVGADLDRFEATVLALAD